MMTNHSVLRDPQLMQPARRKKRAPKRMYAELEGYAHGGERRNSFKAGRDYVVSPETGERKHTPKALYKTDRGEAREIAKHRAALYKDAGNAVARKAPSATSTSAKLAGRVFAPFATAASLQSSYKSAKTPTEEYARRQGDEAGRSLSRDIGIRARGVMEDQLGIGKKKYRSGGMVRKGLRNYC